MYFGQLKNMSIIKKTTHSEFRLASDPKTETSKLSELAKSDQELIRGAVASNISTPKDVLAFLEHDESIHVQECLSTREAARKLSVSLQPTISKTWH